MCDIPRQLYAIEDKLQANNRIQLRELIILILLLLWFRHQLGCGVRQEESRRRHVRTDFNAAYMLEYVLLSTLRVQLLDQTVLQQREEVRFVSLNNDGWLHIRRVIWHLTPRVSFINSSLSSWSSLGEVDILGFMLGVVNEPARFLVGSDCVEEGVEDESDFLGEAVDPVVAEGFLAIPILYRKS